MFARKENKEYKINESMKNAYLNDGYDIYDKDGEVIEYSPKKKITMNEHLEEVAKLKEEIEVLKATPGDTLQEEIKTLKAELEKANKVPKNATELKKVNEELTAAKAALEAEVAELKAQIETLTKDGENNGEVQE